MFPEGTYVQMVNGVAACWGDNPRDVTLYACYEFEADDNYDATYGKKQAKIRLRSDVV